MLEDIFLPERAFPNITDHNLEDQFLYDIFAHKYGVRLTKAEESFECTVADRFEARVLGIRKGDPLLLVWRTLYSFDAVVEFRKTVLRSDRCRYTTVTVTPLLGSAG
jgi:GntR family transcriptional regulator